MDVSKDQRHTQQHAQHSGQSGQTVLPEMFSLRQQFAENDIQHRSGGKAEGNGQQQGIHGPHAIAQQCAKESGQSAEGGDPNGGGGPGAPRQQRRGNAHALGEVVQANNEGGQDSAAPGRAGEGCANGHAHGHIVEGHRRSQHQSRRMESVVSAGAEFTIVRTQVGVVFFPVIMFVFMPVVVVMFVLIPMSAMAVGVVGLLVDPAVEEIGPMIVITSWITAFVMYPR